MRLHPALSHFFLRLFRYELYLSAKRYLRPNFLSIYTYQRQPDRAGLLTIHFCFLLDQHGSDLFMKDTTAFDGSAYGDIWSMHVARSLRSIIFAAYFRLEEGKDEERSFLVFLFAILLLLDHCFITSSRIRRPRRAYQHRSAHSWHGPTKLELYICCFGCCHLQRRKERCLHSPLLMLSDSNRTKRRNPCKYAQGVWGYRDEVYAHIKIPIIFKLSKTEKSLFVVVSVVELNGRRSR